MGQLYYQSDVATYAEVIAKWPLNSAALLALPAGTRFYVEDMGCEIARSASGKSWVPLRGFNGMVPVGTGPWYLSYGKGTSISSSTAASRLKNRPVLYFAPGWRPKTTSGFTIYQNAAGTASTGANDAFDIRIYQCDPLCRPIESAAPLHVFSYNAAGSGGAGVGTLASAGNNGKWIPHINWVGGNFELPWAFFLQIVHNYDTLAPNMSTNSAANAPLDGCPLDLTPGTSTANAPNKNVAYGLPDDVSWTAGATPAWTAGSNLIAGGTAAPVLAIAWV